MIETTIKNIRREEYRLLNELRLLLNRHVEIRGEVSMEEEHLMKFLYARELNVVASYKLIINYVKYKKENPYLFENLSIGDADLRAALEASLPELLEQKDRKCRSIIVFHANNWNGAFNFSTIYRAFILCLDYALKDMHVQNNGFVVIVNWEQFTFRKSTWINPIIMQTIIYCLRECFPAKILELHFVASPWYINAAFNIFKMSFSESLRQNFHIHGRNLITLHKFIHKEVLPTELGGSRPSYNCADLIEKLENFSQNYE